MSAFLPISTTIVGITKYLFFIYSIQVSDKAVYFKSSLLTLENLGLIYLLLDQLQNAFVRRKCNFLSKSV